MIKYLRLLLFIAMLCGFGHAQQPNIILVICDDLNYSADGIGGHPQAITPNVDAFMSQGVTFTRAQCNAPICGPSRASLVSGLYPHTTGLYGYEQGQNRWNINSVISSVPSLHSHFKNNGYTVYGTGKIHHQNQLISEFDVFGVQPEFGPYPFDGSTYDDDLWHPSLPTGINTNYGSLDDVPSYPGYTGWVNEDFTPFDYVSITDRDSMVDERSVNWAANVLNQTHSQPFFLSVGLVTTHLPNYAPQEYFDLYDINSLNVASTLPNDLDDVSTAMINNSVGYTSGNRRYENFLDLDNQGTQYLKEWTHAYLACVSFVDAEFGRLMDSLNTSPYANNTIVVFVSDHGMHMGEKEAAANKNTGFGEVTKIPFIVKGPGISSGQTCTKPVSLVDIYPSLVDLAGIVDPGHLDGHSIEPLLANPASGNWSGPPVALSSQRSVENDLPIGFFHRADHQHFSVTSEQYRYNLTASDEEELYNLNSDPHEWTNLADDPSYDAVKTSLRNELLALNGRRAFQTSSNLLYNGGFEDHLAGWDLTINGSASGSYETDSTVFSEGIASLKFQVDVFSSANSTQVYSDNLKYESGKTYRLSFWAKCSAGGSQVRGVGRTVENGNTFGAGNFNLTTEWAEYYMDFTPTITTNREARIAIQFLDVDIYNIDDIKVSELVVTDCNGDVSGTAYTDNCSNCVEGNTGQTACLQDCHGTWGGTAYLDNCSICVGGNTGLSDCVQDCNGDWGGTAYVDGCNVCVEGNTGLIPCTEDCNGDFGGSAYLDGCSVCVEGNTGLSACLQDCHGTWGGTAYLDICSICVGGNTGFSDCVQDCNGDMGGTAFVDGCNVCVEGNTGLIPCAEDCHGEFGGSAYLDICGICVGGNTGQSDCVQDCNGDWGGNAYLDNCNTCVEGNSGQVDCVQDCNGDWGGTAYLDACSVCVEGNTGLTACIEDCHGDFGGSAYLDNCSICVAGNTGLIECVQDCNGDWGGTAFIDNCSSCVSGNTGLDECLQDCNGDWGGSAFMDNCFDCVSGNTGQGACLQDCHGDFGGTAFQDNCNICVGGNTGQIACLQDCSGDWGGTAYLDGCSVCVEGSTGLTACLEDCHGDFGGSAYLDICGLCVGGNTGQSYCVEDCNGDWGGSAFLDDCGICVAGNTGLFACDTVCVGNQPIVIIADDWVCENDGPISIGAIPGGGVFEGLGVNSNSFDPQGLLGENLIQYAYTDSVNCVTKDSFLIMVLSSPEIQLVNSQDVNCSEDGGSVSVEVLGGQSPYEYQWDDSSASNSEYLEGLGVGTYTLDLTDLNGCTAVYSHEVSPFLGNQPMPVMEIEVKTTSAILKWDAEGYNGFQLAYKLVEPLDTVKWVSKRVAEADSLKILDLLPDTLYKWKIKDKCDLGTVTDHGWSLLRYFRTEEVNCSKPSNLRASITGVSTVLLEWDAAGVPLSKVAIRPIAPQLGVYSTPLATGEQLQRSGLYPGFTYEWKVMDQCNYPLLPASTFGWSEPDTIIMPEGCSAPYNISIDSIGAGQVTVSWEGPDSVMVAWRKTPEKWKTKRVAGKNSVVLTQLDSGSAYSLKIKDLCGGFSPPKSLFRWQDLLSFSTDPGTSRLTASQKTNILNINVFPSPFFNNLNVLYETRYSQELTLEILDLLGRSIWVDLLQSNSGFNEFQLSTESLSAGVYFLRIGNDKETKVIKIQRGIE